MRIVLIGVSHWHTPFYSDPVLGMKVSPEAPEQKQEHDRAHDEQHGTEAAKIHGTGAGLSRRHNGRRDDSTPLARIVLDGRQRVPVVLTLGAARLGGARRSTRAPPGPPRGYRGPGP
jgi:hypothetical protein